MKELIEGYKHFAATADKDFYSELTKGQKPHTLVISCSDSRIIPEEIFSAKPGEIFVLRNVGNLAKTDESSVQACIDYAVLHLGIKNIVVLGHSCCGAVKASEHKEHLDTSGLRSWLAEEEYRGDSTESAEKDQTLRQLDKLLKYPAVQEKIASGSLTLQAMYFALSPLKMEVYREGEWREI